MGNPRFFIRLAFILTSLFFLSGQVVKNLSGEEAAGTVTAIEGQAEVKSEKATDWRQLKMRDRIYPNDTVKTGEGARVEIFFVDETTINIGPQAVIKIDKFVYSPSRNHRESRMNVSMGKVRFNVRRLFSPQSNFEVATPTAVAGVKGTRFLVWVISLEITRTIVMDGEVALRNIRPEVPGEILLRRNFFSDIRQNSSPERPEAIEKNDLLKFLQEVAVSRKEKELVAPPPAPPRPPLPPDVIIETDQYNPQRDVIKLPPKSPLPGPPPPPQ